MVKPITLEERNDLMARYDEDELNDSEYGIYMIQKKDETFEVLILTEEDYDTKEFENYADALLWASEYEADRDSEA